MNWKWLLGCLACLGFYASLTAQVHVGVNGGGGLDNLVSLRASIPMEVAFSKTLSLQSGFTFTQQHTPALLFRLGYQRDYRRATIGYLGVPLLVKVRFTMSPFSLYTFAGPQLDYGAALHVTYIEDGLLNSEKLDFSRWQIARWNVSAVAGVGIEKIIHNNCKIRFELLYLLGLTDIDRRSFSSIYTEGKVFNLGFMIPL
ncbi:MAG: outer membrane beta-barrel protein [Saprospiraceae bacterium]